MRHAPAYSAELFPRDFTVSATSGLLTATLLGPAVWWIARGYLQRTYPHHPEMLGAAVVTALLDGFLLAVFAFIICFACRIWLRERGERRASDEALRTDLNEIAAARG